MSRLPTGVVTFLLTDIEGSTRRWEDEPVAMAVAVRRHYAIIDEVVAAWRGVRPEEQGEGDSTVTAFAAPVDALAAAAEVQCAIFAEAWPTREPLRVRAALNAGEVWVRNEENYFGPVIIRAARLRGAAHGGQTLVAESVRRMVGNADLPAGMTLLDLGVHRLRDLARAEPVYQVVQVGLPHLFPPLKSLDASPNNLPVTTSHLIGRDPDVRQVRGLFGSYRLVTLTGGGGAGKTRLALQVAADVGDQFADGVWFVELAPALAETVVQAVADAVGVRESPTVGLADVVAASIGERSMLLVIDNCEHVLAAASSLVATLVRRCPRLAILATSQRPLGVTGEAQHRVLSLSLPPGDATRPEDVVASTAVRLFVDRAARARPGFELRPENARAVAEICRRLDGIPLAIELAAARVNALSPAQIAAGLDDRFRLLSGGPRTEAPRHQTLLASVTWSHGLLSPAEQVMLRRLAVFADSFDLDAVDDVCNDADQAYWDLVDVVGGLVDSSLVTMEDHGDVGRYRMLETLRLFGRARLAEAGEEEAVTDRFVAWALDVARKGASGLEGGQQVEWLSRLEADHDNVRAALASATGRPGVLAELAIALAPFWAMHGHYEEAGRWFDLARQAPLPPGEAARLACGHAQVLISAGLHERARVQAEQGLELAVAVGDMRAEARALSALGALGVRTDPEGKRPLLVRAAQLGRDIGDRWCEAVSTLSLGHSYAVQEEHAAARPFLAHASSFVADLGNNFLRGWVDSGRAWGAWRLGDFAAATAFAVSGRDAGRLVRELGAEAYGVRWLALTEAAQGRPGEGVAALDDLVRTARRAGALGLAEVVVTAQSYVALVAGALDVVEPPDDEVPDRERGVIHTFGRWVWGLAALARGDLVSAMATADCLERFADRLDSRSWRASGILLRAGVERSRGDLTRAAALAHHVLEVRLTLGERPGVVDVLEFLASIEPSAQATVHRATAAAEREVLGYSARVLVPVE